MFNVAEREFGGLDVVCPGAGVYEPVSQSILLTAVGAASNGSKEGQFRIGCKMKRSGLM